MDSIFKDNILNKDAIKANFISSLKLGVLEIWFYFEHTPVLQIAKDAIFYYLVFSILSSTLLYVYGYGIVLSVKKVIRVAVKYGSGLMFKLPYVARKIDEEVVKADLALEKEMLVKSTEVNHYNELPSKGLSEDEIMKEMDSFLQMPHNDWENGKVSGAVYHGGQDLIKLQSAAFEKFCVTNQLHPDSFPGLRKMDSEVVSMCLRVFNAPIETGCGTSSSGGTESLLLACLSAKMYGLRKKGITHPEIIAPLSVHAGIDKACYYFNIKLHKVPLTKDYQCDVSYVKRLLNRNTVLLVGSAPNFPYGTIDPIEKLSDLAVAHKIPLHVDCCLGSFIIGFSSKAGFTHIPTFDFRLPGVTSISCDTHKYGFAPKGSSVIMYRNKELRASQYYVSTDWCGGLYGSPTLSGSRPGSLMAGCWATMLHIGAEGYTEYCKEIVNAAQYFKKQIRADFPELTIMGEPILSVVAFTSEVVNVYDLSEMMNKKGWHLSALQDPPALHVAFTVPAAKAVKQLLKELKVCIEEMKKLGTKKATSDTAQLYGTAGNISTSTVVDRMIEKFLDNLYKV